MAKMLVRKVRSSCAALISSSRSCGCCSAALLTSTSSRPSSATVLVEVPDRDVGALLGAADRDRPADAAVAARDQDHPPFELAGAAVGAHLGARPGRHLGLKPRLTVLFLGGVMRRRSRHLIRILGPGSSRSPHPDLGGEPCCCNAPGSKWFIAPGRAGADSAPPPGRLERFSDLPRSGMRLLFKPAPPMHGGVAVAPQAR